MYKSENCVIIQDNKSLYYVVCPAEVSLTVSVFGACVVSNTSKLSCRSHSQDALPYVGYIY